MSGARAGRAPGGEEISHGAEARRRGDGEVRKEGNGKDRTRRREGAKKRGDPYLGCHPLLLVIKITKIGKNA